MSEYVRVVIRLLVYAAELGCLHLSAVESSAKSNVRWTKISV
jgi:hypothetical protein